MITRDLADKYIRRPKGLIAKIKTDYRTGDIIRQILIADKTAFRDVRDFAAHLYYGNLRDLCKQLFDFLLYNIKYIEDTSGSQLVKLPSVLWAQKEGDCKSISLFIGAVLKAKGIPYTYRFASYANNGIYTHVYPIAHGINYDVIVDVVYKKFNQEKDYKYKKDYTMKGLYQIEGIGDKPAGVLDIFKPIEDMTEADMEAAIVKQRLEIEKGIVDRVKGVGSFKSDRYQRAIDGISGFIGAAIDEDEDKMDAIIGKASGRAKEFLKKYKRSILPATGDSDVDSQLKDLRRIKRLFAKRKQVAGIGSQKWNDADESIERIDGFIGAVVSGDENEMDEQIGKAKGKLKAKLQKVKAKVKTAAKKAGKVIKKVAVTALKVATLPTRLLMKGILEVSLPSASPAFLYLFIKDQKTIDKLPPAAKKKREKQKRVANFIVKGIGMKEEHFMGILRNGIMKRYGVSPEKKIEQMMSGKVSGIGSVAAVVAVLSALKKIIDFIKKIKGNKQTESLDANDLADEKDFSGMTEEEKYEASKEVLQQKNAIEPGKSLDSDTSLPADGGGRLKGICG